MWGTLSLQIQKSNYVYSFLCLGLNGPFITHELALNFLSKCPSPVLSLVFPFNLHNLRVSVMTKVQLLSILPALVL